MKKGEVEFNTSEHLYQTEHLHFHGKEREAAELQEISSGFKAMEYAHAVLPEEDLSESWHQCRVKVMMAANRIKLKQCEHVRAELVESTGRLVEATSNLWWGSGMPPELTRTTLPGKNKLGEVLSKLRDEFWTRAENPQMPDTNLRDIGEAGLEDDSDMETVIEEAIGKRKASSPLENSKAGKWVLR